MGIEQQVESTLDGLGYELVEFRIVHSQGKVCVFMDRAGGIRLSDCERVTHQLEGLFAAEGFEYGVLEVSSPGPNRRLTKPEHYRRFAGRRVSLTLREGRGDTLRRRFKGVIGLAADAGTVSIDCEDGSHVFGLDEIWQAKLTGSRE